MGFTPSKAEADIWIQENGGLYEYIAVYVDDLLIDVINFTTWTVPYVMDQGSIFILSWDNMRTFLVANQLNIHRL
jgi:hypothetical protein